MPFGVACEEHPNFPARARLNALRFHCIIAVDRTLLCLLILRYMRLESSERSRPNWEKAQAPGLDQTPGRSRSNGFLPNGCARSWLPREDGCLHAFSTANNTGCPAHRKGQFYPTVDSTDSGGGGYQWHGERTPKHATAIPGSTLWQHACDRVLVGLTKPDVVLAPHSVAHGRGGNPSVRPSWDRKIEAGRSWRCAPLPQTTCSTCSHPPCAYRGAECSHNRQVRSARPRFH